MRFMLDAWPSRTRREPGSSIAGHGQDLARLIGALKEAFASPGLSADKARRLAALAKDAAIIIRRRSDDEPRRRRMPGRAEAAEMIASLRRRQKTIDAAMSVARAGVWECRLSDETLEWTGGVYDLFGFRRGARLRRNDVTGCYTAASLAALDQARDRAIRTGGAFGLDAEIVTMRGLRRWVRLTGQVERRNGVAVRVFGLKQDVTEARTQLEEARRAASTDALTGLANQGGFQARLAEASADGRRIGALLMVDLDGFKQINDTFGHAFGDLCLRTAARRMTTVCGDADLVARIGGDEFAILLGDGCLRERAERLAQRIVEALSLPMELDGVTLRFGASVGVAHASDCSGGELFTQADAALYAAKAAGRGGFRTFSEAADRSTQLSELNVARVCVS
jgi:diguanylate cyclase (GGDEF)-like protein